MLLARLTSKTQEIDNKVYSPYADMNSTNDLLLIRFIDTIEDLEKWTNVFENGVTEKDSETLLEMLNSWVNMKNTSDELVGEKAAYFEIRDIKPENIMITSDGTVKIIDYSISRLIKPDKRKDTTVLGTAGYASPEQFGFAQTSSPVAW